jgi:hypothetical protein
LTDRDPAAIGESAMKPAAQPVGLAGAREQTGEWQGFH